MAERTDIKAEARRTGRSLTTPWRPRPAIFATLQVAGTFGAVWALWTGVGLAWWMLALSVYFVTSCLGMAVAVHRGLTHDAFRMVPWLNRTLSLAAALGGTGSPLGWIAVHREHHATADTEEDPHGPGAHGWLLLVRGAVPKVDWWRVRDIMRDPVQRRLHSHYTLILLAWGLLLLAIHPLALVMGFLVPAAAQIWVTNLSTILAHGWGYRNFDTRDDSTNNVLIALLTWGEGWHNNHHARPRSWILGLKWWEFDPAGRIVQLLAARGLIERESLVEDLTPAAT